MTDIEAGRDVDGPGVPRPRLDVPEARRRTVMAGEAPIKQAVKWIDDQLHDDPRADRMKLVDQAARRFDLSPLDAEFLIRHLTERGRGAG